MVATYSINSPLNRQERTNLNDSLQDALSRLNSLQRQINTLSGGVEIEALLNEIGDTINNANTSISDINALIDRANEYLVTFEQAERNVNEAVTLANNATASANRAVQNLDGALQDTIEQANTTINQSLQTNTRTVDDLVVRTEAELNGTIESVNQTIQGVVQTAEQLNADLAGYNIPISDFNLSTAYTVNQPVRFNGTTYRAKTATQNNPLPNNSQVENTWWTLEAQRGVDGEGAVSSVAGKMPSIDGNVDLTPQDISALGQEHLVDQLHRHVEVVNELPTNFNGRGILFRQVGATSNTPERPSYEEILDNVNEVTTQLAQKANKEEINTLATEKADKTYVDNLTQSLASGSPKGTYATLSALQTAFPNGNSNIYLVLGDGKWYYWNGTTWTAGGQYQSTGIADGSITTAKRTPLGERVFLLKGTNSVPNFNTQTKTLTIYNDTIIVFNTKNYVVNANVTIDCSPAVTTSENIKILFNTVDYSFRAVWFRTAPSENEVILCTAKTSAFPYLMDVSFEFTIDGVFPTRSIPLDKLPNITSDKILDVNPLWKQTNILTNGNYPRVNNIAKTLTFPGGSYNFIFYAGGTAYDNFTTLSSLVIDLSLATGSTAWCVLLNLSTRQLELKVWNSVETFKKTHALFATFRIINGKYHFTMPCPFYVDDKLYGADYTTREEVQQILTGFSTTTLNLKDANVKAVCHRGYNTAPENTLPAYKIAKEKGFAYVECDVEWTSDGVPVLLHDSSINRTARNTNGTQLTEVINIRNITLETARTYDYGIYKSPTYAGTKIPTFEEFILFCKKLDLHPYIELKGDVTTEQVLLLVNIVKKLGMIKRVTWISFYLESLNKVLNLVPKARIGYVTMSTSKAKIDQAVAVKTEINDVFVDMYSIEATKELVEYALLAGIDIESWTVNDAATLTNLVNLGVTGITTDFINVAEILSE